jgi:hypothetical protein
MKGKEENSKGEKRSEGTNGKGKKKERERKETG